MSSDVPSLRVEFGDDSFVHLRWKDGHLSKFHPLWLRQNCRCPKCCQHRSGQRIVKFKDIPETLTYSDSSYSEETGLTIQFEEENDHQVQYSIDWLRSHDCSPQAFQRKNEARQPKAAKTLQKVDWADLDSEESIWNLVNALMTDGLFVVQNVPTELEFVPNVAEKVGPVLLCLYDKVMNVRAFDDPINGNIAHTTSWLPFHEDIPYVEACPGVQLLHCVKFDECVEGGENLFIDAFAMCEQLREKHPDHFHTLTRVPATFQMMHKADKVSSPFCLRYQTPHIMVNNRDEIIGFRFSPNQEGPLQVPEEDQGPFYAAYRALIQAINNADKIKYRQQPGDVVFFNNRRMLHSREAYTLNGGERHLQGVYMSMTDFVNKYGLLAGKYGKDGCFGVRVGDNNYM